VCIILSTLSKRQGDVVDSLWVGGAIHSAASPDGPFRRVGAYPGGNPAPAFHGGAFYMTKASSFINSRKQPQKTS